MIDLISGIAWFMPTLGSAAQALTHRDQLARRGTLGYESQQPAPVSGDSGVESLMSPDNSGVRGADDSDTAVANC